MAAAKRVVPLKVRVQGSWGEEGWGELAVGVGYTLEGRVLGPPWVE